MKISDEARELVCAISNCGGYGDEGDWWIDMLKASPIAQQALDDARNCALEDAANFVSETRGIHGYAQAAEIRAMKVQP